MKKILLILISMMFLLIGFMLHVQSAYTEMENSAQNTMNHIFSPMDLALSQTYELNTFDEDRYINEAKENIFSLSFKMIDFHKSLTSGFAFLIAGFTLLLFTTRHHLKNFLKSVFDLAF